MSPTQRVCRQLSIAPALGLACLLAIGGAYAEEVGTVTVVGTLNDEGAECPAMQGDDGKVYTLTPRTAVGRLQAGARVRVTGTVAEMSFCQQGTTIEVTRIEPAQ